MKMNAAATMQDVPTEADMRESVVADSMQGWLQVESAASVLWFKGHLHAGGLARLKTVAAEGVAAVRNLLPELDGCFGLIVVDENVLLAAADPIASIPVFMARNGQRCLVGSLAADVKARAGLSQVDPDAALALGLAGFTLGERALFAGLRHLRAGEMAVIGKDHQPAYSIYAAYRPWKAVERPRAQLSDDLADVLRNVFAKMIASAQGRPIIVPLSAGFDSRLIAAALKELRYPDVRCYAYGIPGNHEATASRAIAERLGLPWTFIPVTPASQRDYFTSQLHAEFVRYAETFTSLPFNQDYDATRRLIESGYAPRDAIFVNGQTGDYISGNHIPESLWQPSSPSDPETRWSRLFAAARAKHFDLWEHLATKANLARIEAQFRSDLERGGGLPVDPANDWALYEVSEFLHRQSRYVVSGQRCYEHLGVDWRLPLWDRDLVSFFETAPLSAKKSQSLYKETLRRLDWGKVWDLPVNRKTVRPRWLAPVRLVAKAVAAPLGRETWHRLERRTFAWHMDTLANYAVVPWKRVAQDRRGFRNAISWHAEAYLARHGIALDALAA
jgi:asparagine synthase (glutamine-hydrolysing)